MLSLKLRRKEKIVIELTGSDNIEIYVSDGSATSSATLAISADPKYRIRRERIDS